MSEKIDLLFVSWNRKAFTRMALACMLENTNWELVDELHLYDDESTDGTEAVLAVFVTHVPAAVKVVFQRQFRFGGPVAIMNRFMRTRGVRSPNRFWAKLDSDTCVPPGWLDESLAVMQRGGIDLLGIEALDDLALREYGSKDVFLSRQVTGTFSDVCSWDEGPSPLNLIAPDGRNSFLLPHVAQKDFCRGAPNAEYINIHTERTFRRQSHIGGIGLMSYEAWKKHPYPSPDGRQGFTQWQHKHDDIVKGFLMPRLPVCLLDRVPIEPWKTLSKEYIAAGWQRDWGPYDPDMEFLWRWMSEECKHEPVILHRTGGAQRGPVDLANVCGKCGDKIERAVTTDPWRSAKRQPHFGSGRFRDLDD